MEELNWTTIIISILSTLTTVGASIWALVKTILPKLIEAKIEDRKDTRDFEQELKKAQQSFNNLQTSWTADKLTDILEQDESFIRDIVTSFLRDILKTQDDVKDEIKKFAAQAMIHRDTTANLSVEVIRLKREVTLIFDFIRRQLGEDLGEKGGPQH